MTPTRTTAVHRASAQHRGTSSDEMRLPALQVRQGPTRTLYSFAVDGKQLPSFATVSRIHRDANTGVQGYQRPEVLSHISAIRKYLESEEPMIPNAIVIAFDKRVVFEPAGPADGYTLAGTLVIPLDSNAPDEDKPGWVVDGQQRCAAIREARVDAFPVCVTAFITESDAEQRSQFILVNSTKPLPKGLIHELLPSTVGALPTMLQLRRFPATLLERLNYDDDSPLEQLIHTPTTPQGLIKDNSILRMLENSLSDGALYQYRQAGRERGDIESMLALLKDFWVAVRNTFPSAWGQPPRRSRLTHGVGIASMGFVMDAITDRYAHLRVPSTEDFEYDLDEIADLCAWTEGTWWFGPDHHRKWNDLQNTPRDIQLLTNYLLGEYRARTYRRPVRRQRRA
jgi:DGQHR domain-containing protein